MTDIVVPETCWASNNICNKKPLLHLVGILFPQISKYFIKEKSIRWTIQADYIRHNLYSNRVLSYKRLDSTRQFSFAVQEAKHELQTTKSLLHARKQITGNGNIQPTYQALRYLWEAMSGRRELSTLIFYCCSRKYLIVYYGINLNLSHQLGQTSEFI